MRYKITLLLLLFNLNISCAGPGAAARSGYLVTDYDSNGAIEEVYLVKKVDIEGDRVSFTVDGKKKTISGSFKVDKFSDDAK